jgi:hypothetical protein
MTMPMGKYHRRQDFVDIQGIALKLKIFKNRLKVLLLAVIWR